MAFDKVTFFLAVVAVAAIGGLAFVGFSPNRILTPQGIALWNAGAVPFALLMGAGALAMLAGAVLPKRATGERIALAGAVLLFLADFATAGTAAAALVAAADSTAARVSLGGAFWLVLVASGLAIAENLRRHGVRLWLQAGLAIALVAVLALMAMAGWFDHLSIVREWSNRRDQYNAAFAQHLILTLSALGLALAIGLPLGAVAAGRPVASGRIFSVLSLIQTIPSIALFGLLIGPLTALSGALPFLRDIGIRGIGFTPALIALTMYGLLPVARNTEAGLKSVPPSAIDTARGMGMTPFQIMVWVSLPLALPVLLAGLRIVTVQLIGLTVVAALIGAGGFGSFVFIGLGQTATDLVLLGALSAILLALVADVLLRLLTIATTRAISA